MSTVTLIPTLHFRMGVKYMPTKYDEVSKTMPWPQQMFITGGGKQIWRDLPETGEFEDETP